MIEQPVRRTVPKADWFYAICPTCFKLQPITDLKWPVHVYGVNLLNEDIQCPQSTMGFEGASVTVIK